MFKSLDLFEVEFCPTDLPNEPHPIGGECELGHRSLRIDIKNAGNERGGGRKRTPLCQGSAGAYIPVCNGEYRLDLVLARQIKTLLHEQPYRIGGRAKVENDG
jgi:hypothetical protein